MINFFGKDPILKQVCTLFTIERNYIDDTIPIVKSDKPRRKSSRRMKKRKKTRRK
jgi:hypothetical protein